MAKSRVQVKCPKCGEVFLPSIEEIQSRAGKSARRKGHAFERRVAKQLQDWWNTNRELKCEMRRTPQSGGSVLKVGWGLAGDIATTAVDFPWSIECKHVASSYHGIHQFFSAEKFVVWDWWEQATRDCPAGKIPLLVINRFDQPTLCMSDSRVAYKLEVKVVPFMVFYRIIKEHQTTPVLYIWSFDDMLSTPPTLWSNS